MDDRSERSTPPSDVLALVGFDAGLAAHLVLALTAYLRLLDAGGRARPERVEELVAALREHIDKSRHLRARVGGVAHDARTSYLLDATSAARLLDISERTLDRRVAEGRIPTVGDGHKKFRPEDLWRYLVETTTWHHPTDEESTAA